MTERSFETIKVQRDGRCVVITLARPDQLNVLDPQMLRELITAATDAADSDTNVIVLRGSGRMFCAGVDLDTRYFMEDMPDDSAFAGMHSLDEQHELISVLHELPVVSIASVNGDAIGGAGFGMALACDLRYAVRSARFWLVAGQFGAVQDYGLSWFLRRDIGVSRTIELAFTGRRVDAATGEDWGFLNGVLDTRDALAAHVDEVAQGIAGMGPDAARMLKHVIRAGRGNTLGDQLKLESVANALCFSSEEFSAAKDLLRQRLGKGTT